jgi:A/G-specific adenine glycosylase
MNNFTNKLTGTSKNKFANNLLTWWDTSGRHDLPWQQNPVPYRVWVSEIMLQQTQVATVEGYFDRFMQSFPDVVALAQAPQDKVLHHWSGLGYYSRARNLHKAAQQIVNEHGAQLPETFDELLELAGIGPSTAGAILSLSMGQRQPILDGNVKRVLARVFCIEGWSGATKNMQKLWELAEQCTPYKRVNHYTQAIMDLGATLCTRSRPCCTDCPLQSSCQAYANNLVAQIPAPKPKKVKPRRSTVMLMAVNREGEILLQKRPQTGIWGGLWSFPELESSDAVAGWCQQQFAHIPEQSQAWPVVAHSFSHFDLDMTPVEVRLSKSAAKVMDGDQWLWYNTRSPAGVGLAAPVAKLLKVMAEKALDARSGEQS